MPSPSPVSPDGPPATSWRPPERVEGREARARRLAAAGHPEAVDRLVDLARRLVGAESAQVSVISDVQTIAGSAGGVAGTTGTESPAADSLCTVTVGAAAPVVVPDAAADERVRNLPPVAGGAVGSYLGVPLVAAGDVVGALCVFDAAPRTWTEAEVALLADLAEPVVGELELAALADDYRDDRLVWQLAVDAAEVGAWDWDLTTGDLRWDERLLEIFGVDADGFGGTIEAFSDFVHPEDRPKVTQALDEALRTVGGYAAEYRVVRPDGVVRWVRARGRALPGPDGAAARLVGAAYDTTAVQDGEAWVARALDTMPAAFFTLDPEWRFTFVNEAATRLLSAAGELLGRSMWDLFPAAVGTPVEDRYREAVDTGRPVTFETYYGEPLEAWFEVTAWPGPDGLSVYFGDVTERRRADAVLERVARRTAVLAEVTDALIGTLDVDDAGGRLARAVVPGLGDWSVVTLADAFGEPTRGEHWRRSLRGAASWHRDAELRPVVERYAGLRIAALTDTSFLDEAFGQDRPKACNADGAAVMAAMFGEGEIRDLALRLDAGAFAAMPLRGRDRTLGLLSVFRDPASGPFSDDDLDLLADVGDRAGLALDNVRLYAQQRDVAEVLQRSMMTAPPHTDQVEVAVRYVSAAEAAQVGGDWYDAFHQEPGVTMVAIGDVVGHDTEAAAAMSQVRSLLRGIAAHTGDGPADVLRGVDRAMVRLALDTTATAVVARFEQTEQERVDGVVRVRWSNAGHPPPMVVVTPDPAGDGAPAERDWRLGERPDEAIDALWSDRFDLLLGLDPETPRTETVVTLHEGATVWLYTDGLVERRGQALDEGLTKLRAVLDELAAGGSTLEEACEELLRRMLPVRPEDDVALVAVRLRPSGS